jgi:hypothetical protein
MIVLPFELKKQTNKLGTLITLHYQHLLPMQQVKTVQSDQGLHYSLQSQYMLYNISYKDFLTGYMALYKWLCVNIR